MDEIEQTASDVLCLFGFNPEEIPQEDKTYVFFGSHPCIERPDVVQIFYAEGECDYSSFSSFCEERFFQVFSYHIHPRLTARERDLALNAQAKCEQIQWHSHCLASDVQDFGLKAFMNLVKSRDRVFDGSSFADLKGVFQGVPAFVCGAGDSLAPAMPHLKERKGLVFAGGAALGLLTKSGVEIDIAAGIDPDPDIKRNTLHGSLGAPFFYPSRCKADLVDAMQGRLFQVPSNPGYPLASWFEELEGFDGGWTAVTFCAALAVHFGCNPIVFVGADLSSPLTVPSLEKGFLFEDPVRGKVWTKKDWVLSARWLEGLIAENPRICFESASCGLTIRGTKEFSWEVCQERYDLDFYRNLLVRVWKKQERGEEKWKELEDSLERAGRHLQELLLWYERIYPADPRGKGGYVLALFDLEEELAHQKILAPLWRFWRFSLEKDIAESCAKELNRLLFFMRVIEQYRSALCQEPCAK